MRKRDKFLLLAALLLSALVLAPALSWAQYGGLAVFMRIDGIPGESTDTKHKDWIDVFQYKGGIDVPDATFNPGGGQSAPVPKFSPVTIQKLLDKATPKLAQAAASGQHIKLVTIEFVKQTGPGGGDKNSSFRLS